MKIEDFVASTSTSTVQVYDQDLLSLKDGLMDDLQFTSFSTVFQSYQDDEQMIMKGLCNGTLVMVEKI